MNRSIHLFIILALVCTGWSSSVVQADETSGQAALAWLTSRQNADGSWGVDPSVRPLYTSAAVGALRSFYQQNGAYYAGIAWLENHDAENLDYLGRKMQSLIVHGDSVQSLADAVIQARWSVTGSQGWGLSDTYSYTPLDTALALSALRNTGWSDYIPVLTYLQSCQNADGGWGVGPAAASDTLTTAIVTQALCKYEALYPQIDAAVTSAEGYLAGQVGVGDSALLRAETVLALLPNGRQTVKAYELLDALETDQNTAGDWDDDPYATARVVRAMAMALGKDPDALGVLSDVCDTALRNALNGALNKNAADAVTLGEMGNVTSLSAAGAGIADLCGMQDAANLTYADLRNNGITSLQALVGLSNLETVLLDGNPLSDTEDADGDGFSDLAELQGGSNPLDSGSVPTAATAVPAVNTYGLLLAAAALLVLGLKKKWRDQMLNPHRSTSMVVAVCISTALLASILCVNPAAALDEAVLQELPAEQVEQIKGVGRALLQAKRSYQPPEETLQLHEDVKQLHALLETLTKPIEGDTLRLESAPVKVQGSQKPRDPWREKRAGQVDQLLGLADRIAEQGHRLAAKNDTRQRSRQEVGPMLSSASKPALTRLGQLRGELDQALALPANERQERLMQIKDQLQLGRRPFIRQTNGPAETPTLMNRTRHRPMGR